MSTSNVPCSWCLEYPVENFQIRSERIERGVWPLPSLAVTHGGESRKVNPAQVVSEGTPLCHEHAGDE